MNTCENCFYWKDYTDRVIARLSAPPKSNHYRGNVELRACKFRPAPNIETSSIIYTDGGFSCSEHRVIPKE